MQVKKRDVREKILNAAKSEFLEKGFEKSSLRQIASKANVTKGNIYNYFKSKDDLFYQLVKPALDVITRYMTQDFEEAYFGENTENFFTLEKSQQSFRNHIDLVTEHYEILKLLFFGSSGSSLSDFKERIIRLYEASSFRFYDIVKKKNPSWQSDMSYLFIHSCATLYISFVEEIVIHRPDEKLIEKYVLEMATFVHFGIKGMMESK